VQQAARTPQAQFIAGGTNLVDRLKVFLDIPDRLIDISRLGLTQIDATPEGGVRIGALATNTAVADHPRIRRDYPLLARAILAGASQQIRNVATVGGNVLQRTRCPYYYDTAFACNRRQPGSGCPALQGLNRTHAILGASDRCVAVHPSDMAVALAALDAVVEVASVRGQRQIPFGELHRLPGDAPQRETTLEPGELVTGMLLPPLPLAKTGVYLKLRDRASYAFALVSVAAAVEIQQGRIQTARLALGGVAPKPWRSPSAEAFLQGQPATANIFRQAAALALQGAQPLAHNGFKIPLATQAIERALTQSAQAGGDV
jgi:xanthine dehydrogenase YagS FAD-binding subunit